MKISEPVKTKIIIAAAAAAVVTAAVVVFAIIVSDPANIDFGITINGYITRTD
ncbi:hypothetical protein [Huintestinicola sp.]|uniref:hypothetical protein n=1 Tax=Huintestinicola sp. TaxID=2981661 RepID=UPI003D7E7D33